MKAMILNGVCDLNVNREPLQWIEMNTPEPDENQVLIKISACGVCHTELDEIEGRTPPPHFPMIPGHQGVGRIVALGPKARRFNLGDKVGIGWIYSACGRCPSCLAGYENLCPLFQATGRDVHGCYAGYIAADESFVYRIPSVFTDSEAAPLLCAGAIGYRSLKLTQLQNGQNLGLTGFGASAHLVLKMVRHRYPLTRVYVFARSLEEQRFACELGAVWAGDTSSESPEKLHCIIDTTPVWMPIVEALDNLEPGGRLVINAIRKENIDKEYILNLDYSRHLWMEKEIKSVANVARCDVEEFLRLAAEIPIKPEVLEYPLEDANRALLEIKEKKIRGAKVLIL